MVSYGQQSTLGEGEALLLLPLLMHIAHTKCKVLLLLPLLMHTHQVQPSTIGSLGLEPPLRGLAVLRKSLDTRRMPFEKKGKEIGVICLL